MVTDTMLTEEQMFYWGYDLSRNYTMCFQFALSSASSLTITTCWRWRFSLPMRWKLCWVVSISNVLAARRV